jgi:pimeloyl-ACP methyl ester carboxylesterase
MTSYIRTTKTYFSPDAGKYAFVLCGFGGSIWQLRRLIRVLQRQGYNVIAMDFGAEVLSSGDPSLLPQLVDEVVTSVENTQHELGQPMLLVGVSLGALLALNVLRRSADFDKAVLITGGDIVKVAQRLYPQAWPQSYDDLAKQWRAINMYSDPGQLRGKHAHMVLPTKDKLIDPDDVRQETKRQQQAGNDLELLERNWFGHLGTIIEEAVLFPRRTKQYIARVHQAN